MRRTALTLAVIATLATAGCGASGGEVDRPATTNTSQPPGGSTGPFATPVDVGGLTVTIAEPYRHSFSPEAVEADVTFATTSPEAVPIPDPTLTCDGQTYEIDHDVANYPPEVDDETTGTWGWSPGPACQAGTIDVGDTSFAFDAVRDR